MQLLDDFHSGKLQAFGENKKTMCLKNKSERGFGLIV